MSYQSMFLRTLKTAEIDKFHSSILPTKAKTYRDSGFNNYPNFRSHS